MNYYYLLFFLFHSIALYAQSSGNAYGSKYNADSPITQASFENDSTLVFTVKILQNQQPDAQVAIFSVYQVAESIESCDNFLKIRIEKFKNELQKMGILSDSVWVDMISQKPIFDYDISRKLFSKTATEVPKGFEARRNIHILYKNRQSLEAIISAAAKCEIYDFVKEDVFVNQSDKIWDSLRQMAVELVQKKQATFQKLIGNPAIKYQIPSEDFQMVYPQTRYRRYNANTSTHLPYKVSQVNEIQKNETLYYEQVSYDFFDKVVNPVVLIPPIQFLYELRLKVVYYPIKP